MPRNDSCLLRLLPALCCWLPSGKQSIQLETHIYQHVDECLIPHRSVTYHILETSLYIWGFDGICGHRPDTLVKRYLGPKKHIPNMPSWWLNQPILKIIISEINIGIHLHCLIIHIIPTRVGKKRHVSWSDWFQRSCEHDQFVPLLCLLKFKLLTNMAVERFFSCSTCN